MNPLTLGAVRCEQFTNLVSLLFPSRGPESKLVPEAVDFVSDQKIEEIALIFVHSGLGSSEPGVSVPKLSLAISNDPLCKTLT